MFSGIFGISVFELWGIGQGSSLVALKNKKLKFLRKTVKFSLEPFEIMDRYSENKYPIRLFYICTC